MALKSKSKWTNRQVWMNQVLLWLTFTLIASAPVCVKAQSKQPFAAKAGSRASIISDCKAPQAAEDIEIRFGFNPRGPTTDLSELGSQFIVINGDGSVHALRYELFDQRKNVASYEGLLPEAEVQRLRARVYELFRLPKHRRDYDSRLIYESDGFYLALKLHSPKVKEMFGGVETRPNEVRAFVAEMKEIWKGLAEVPPAYAYLTSKPIESDRLKLIRREAGIRLIPVESLPSELRRIVVRAITEPFNLYPLSRAQGYELFPYGGVVVYKNAGYEVSLFLSEKETKPIRK